MITLNAPFLVRPDPAFALAPAPAPIPHELGRRRWLRLSRAEKRRFVETVGIRRAVREFGLDRITVALVLQGTVEQNLAAVNRALED